MVTRLHERSATERTIPTEVGKRGIVAKRDAIEDAYEALERSMFGTDDLAGTRELLQLTRSQMADDTASNDRARFGGQRTLSLDRFAESGYEPDGMPDTPYMVREEQEALEEGMRPFLQALPMDERDSLSSIYRYSFSYRDAAGRLGLTLPSLQRRVNRAIRNLRAALVAAAGIEEADRG